VFICNELPSNIKFEEDVIKLLPSPKAICVEVREGIEETVNQFPCSFKNLFGSPKEVMPIHSLFHHM